MVSLLVCAVSDCKFEVTKFCCVTICVVVLFACLCSWSLDSGMLF